MKNIRKLIAMCLCATSISALGITNVSAANDDFISEAQATRIATNFVISRAHTTDTDESFPVPFKVVKDETMYDLDDNISAYKFNVVDKEGNYSGYVIAGAQMDYAPIIEYSCSDNDSFIDKTVEEVAGSETDDIKIYYAGGLNYFVETVDDNKIYDAQSATLIPVTKSALQAEAAIQTTSDEQTEDDEQLEDAWENALGQASNPPNDTYISDPLNYESGYTGYTMKYIAGATANMYRLMSSFSDGCGNHCGPTAATNLCILNYKLNGKTKLMNGTWDKTFTKLHTLSKCSASAGTSDSNLKTAIISYGKEMGYSSTSATLVAATESAMRTSITNNVPQILLVNGHGYYKDHFVLTVGVEKYDYTSGSSTYFRVIDGWDTAARYIYFKSSYMTSTITASFN